MAVVTPDLVKHIARLARLRLEGPALTQIAAQLDEILQYVQQLQSVPTDHIEPTTHVLQLSNVLRKDERRPSLSQEAVLALAPAPQRPFVKVPKVIEGS
jgi:aspartyl-tRNA(Asn)/glutamyl-tRNA(Gln) amidotransferase subunit C